MKLQHVFKDLLAEDFKSQTKKYIAQGIDPEIVSNYVNKFKEIRDKKFKEMFDKNLDISVPSEKRNDIDAYKDFHELEQLVDYVGGRRPMGGGSPMGGKEDIEVSGKAVYKDENFEVYYADSPRACIQYKGKFPYSWCVARADSSNMFYTYRFKPYEPAFYFVKNLKLTEKEFGIWNMTKNVFQGKFKYPYHFFVIQVPKNAKPDDSTTDQYIVSSANNDGDKQMSWDDILKISPNLNSIREVLVPKPFTPEERAKNERFKNGISDDEFRRLSYENKRSYLDIYPTIARPITAGQFFELPEDLMNLYVSFGIGLDDNQFNFIKDKKDILKRYAQISKRKLEEYLKEDNYNRNRLNMNFTELSVLDDADIKLYLDSLSPKAINNFIRKYGEDKFEMLEKHLPQKFSDKHKTIKQLVMAANNGDETSLDQIQSMIPDDVVVRFHNNYIVFETHTYGNSYISNYLDSSKKELFDRIEDTSWNGYGYDRDYFDGADDELNDTYTSILESYIQSNQDMASDFRDYGLEWDVDSVKDLLETYDQEEDIKNQIGYEYGNAQTLAEEKEWDEIRHEIASIVFIEDETDVNIKIGPFIMFLTTIGLEADEVLSDDGETVNNTKTGERYRASVSNKEFFSTNRQTFIDHVIYLLENILDGYDVSDNMDSIYEQINEAGYNNVGNIDMPNINREFESGIEKAFDKFKNEDSDNTAPDGTQNIAKLKSQIIQSLNNTLKGLGQDSQSSEIENKIVKIQIDRNKFQLNGKVYIKLTDKENNVSHEGYVLITDLPKYFTNHKLFEQIINFKRFIR